VDSSAPRRRRPAECGGEMEGKRRCPWDGVWFGMMVNRLREMLPVHPSLAWFARSEKDFLSRGVKDITRAQIIHASRCRSPHILHCISLLDRRGRNLVFESAAGDAGKSLASFEEANANLRQNRRYVLEKKLKQLFMEPDLSGFATYWLAVLACAVATPGSAPRRVAYKNRERTLLARFNPADLSKFRQKPSLEALTIAQFADTLYDHLIPAQKASVADVRSAAFYQYIIIQEIFVVFSKLTSAHSNKTTGIQSLVPKTPRLSDTKFRNLDPELSWKSLKGRVPEYLQNFQNLQNIQSDTKQEAKAAPSTNVTYRQGQIVVIKDLVKAKEINGQVGIILSGPSKGRYAVRIRLMGILKGRRFVQEEKKIRIKPANLKPHDPEARVVETSVTYNGQSERDLWSITNGTV